MVDKVIQLFGSKEYHFLNWLKRQEQTTSYGATIHGSQEKIAIEYGSSPATVYKWLQALQSAGCVEQQKKGSYRITKAGNAVIAKMNEIETIVGGKSNGVHSR